MASFSHLLLLFILISIFHQTTCGSIRLPSDEDPELLYCNSWRLSVETNNAGVWSLKDRCFDYVKEYAYSKQYVYDQKVIASDTLAFAKTVNITGDGKDAWVFDIDDTLLSLFPWLIRNLSSQHPTQYIQSKHFHESWKEEGPGPEIPNFPALNTSLKLYNKLKNMGFAIFLLTGRTERFREATVSNLKLVGYSGWKRAILRGPIDEGKPATLYKSQKRAELIYEGYRIHGSSGDQWSDLLGFATAERSFKLPNPAYYVP